MNIDRKKLIKSLEIIENALGGNNDPNEQSRMERQSFRFNKTTVYATNGEIAIETILPFDVGTQCCIHGKSLLNFLKSLGSDNVSAEFGEKQLIVSASGVEGKFVTSPYKEYEHIIDKYKKSKISRGGINKILLGLKNCKSFVSKDKTLGLLCGVKIDKEFIMASDRTRIIKYEVSSEPYGCVIPTTFIDILFEYKDDVYGIQMDDVGLLGFFGHSVIATVIYDDKYPDLDKYFPKDGTNFISVTFKKPDEFKKALGRHIALLKDVDLSERDTCIEISEKACELVTTSKSIGTIKESFEIATIQIKYEAGDLKKFYVDPLLLKQSIGNCLGFVFYPETKLILFNGENSKCLLQTRKPIK